MVDKALHVLSDSGNIRQFGELLHESWMYKRSLSKQVSTHEIDQIYERALQAGAIGGKLIGAGGGGFMMLFVAPEQQPAVRAALSHLIYVPFRFDYTGSQIIYYHPE